MPGYKEFDLMNQELPEVDNQELMEQLLKSLNSMESVEVKVDSEESEEMSRPAIEGDLAEKIKFRILSKIIPTNLPENVQEELSRILILRISKSLEDLKKACPNLDEDSMIGLMLASMLTRQI